MKKKVKHHKITVNIGDTDENADWVKTKKNKASEKKIHEDLAKKKGK